MKPADQPQRSRPYPWPAHHEFERRAARGMEGVDAYRTRVQTWVEHPLEMIRSRVEPRDWPF